MRLKLLRSKVKIDEVVVERNTTIASLENETDPKRERFDLFVQGNPEHLTKKTETQKIVAERDKILRPMSFNDVKISNQWYLKRAEDYVFKRQSLADDPMASFGRVSPSGKSKVPYKEAPKKDGLKQIKDLKKEREIRENRERERAAKLLKSIRH